MINKNCNIANITNITKITKIPNISNRTIFNNKKMPELINIISWNIEDFVMIDKISEDKSLLENLQKQHIILIQEWKENDQSKRFINLLNNKENKFTYVYTDRVAIIYDITIFNNNEKSVYNIKLKHEDPTRIEKLYTKGRQKSNILAILYPYQEDCNPICVVSFHLSAFVPSKHPEFHSKQLRQLIKNAKDVIKCKGIENYDIIIGGDSNYRVTNPSINLKYNLLEKNLSNKIFTNTYKSNSEYKNLIARLTDVCNNKECKKKPTQSFSCVHEKSLDKKIISSLSPLFNKTRLDIILTNLEVQNTVIENKCNLSDHKIISTTLKYPGDNHIVNLEHRNSNYEYPNNLLISRNSNYDYPNNI
jgi:hypothetical protein